VDQLEDIVAQYSDIVNHLEAVVAQYSDVGDQL
jgi:hypothetical protein